MMTSMTLEEAMNRMFTCATAERCVREEACFVIVAEMKKRLETERLQRELNQVVADQEAAAHVIGHEQNWKMPLHWEIGLVDCADWSAA
jgi:hypothetical protein